MASVTVKVQGQPVTLGVASVFLGGQLKGPSGPAGTLAIGTVTTGAPGSAAAVTNVGTPSAAVLDITLPAGNEGEPGPSGTLAIGTVTTGVPGSAAAVTNVGTPSAAVLDITLPAGDDGEPGAAAAVAVGSVTTGAPGSAASVTNVGTSSAAVLDFAIPAGADGDPGAPGTVGDEYGAMIAVSSGELALGGYPCAQSLRGAGTLQRIYAKVMAGTGSATAQLYHNDVAVGSPITVTNAAAVTTGINEVLALGDSLAFNLISSSGITALWLQTDGGTP